MEIVGWILVVLGGLTAIACGVWLLVVMFKESWAWGLGSLVCSFVSLIFVIKFWDEAKRPFLGQIAGLGLMFLGGMAGGPNIYDRSGSKDDVEMAEMLDVEAEKDEASTSVPETSAPPTPAVPAVPLPVARPPSSPTQRVARVAPRPRPTPPQPAVAEVEGEPKPKPAAPPRAKPEPESLLLPGHQSPMDVEVTSVGNDDGTGLRPLNLRITNHTRKTAKQVRMTVYYLGRKKETLKQWSTSIFDPKPSLTSNATIEIAQPAFFMPDLTASVAVKVDSIRFEDRSEWP